MNDIYDESFSLRNPLLLVLQLSTPSALLSSLSAATCYFHFPFTADLCDQQSQIFSCFLLVSSAAFLIWLCSNRLHHSPFFASSNSQSSNSSIFIGLSQSSCNHSALSRSVFHIYSSFSIQNPICLSYRFRFATFHFFVSGFSFLLSRHPLFEMLSSQFCICFRFGLSAGNLVQ